MEEIEELLRRYVRTRSEADLRDLVRQKLDFVYSAALRQVGGDAHMAEEVTQAVFTALVARAPALITHSSLTGWIYTSTRFAATAMLRENRRRLHRESASFHMNASEPANPRNENWAEVAEVLDDAMHDLKETERDAVILRFFEGRTLAAVGARLGLSENGAGKRVDRALEKLRTALGRRGIASTTAALGANLASGAITAAPAGLAGSAMKSAAVAAAAGGSAVAGIALLTMTTVQKALIGTAIAAAVGFGTYETVIAPRRAAELRAGQSQTGTAAAQSEGSRRRNSASPLLDETNRQNSLKAPSGAAAATPAPAPAATVIGATGDTQASPVERPQTLSAQVQRLKELFEQMPDKKIPELQLLGQSDWIAAFASRPNLKLDTEAEIRAAFSTARSKAKEVLKPRMQQAIEAYKAANPGVPLPDDVGAVLAPYFNPSIDPAILSRYTGNRSELSAELRVLGLPPGAMGLNATAVAVFEKTSALVDDEIDTKVQMSAGGYSTMPASKSTGAFAAAMDAYAAANGGAKPESADQLTAYLSVPVDARQLSALLELSRRSFRTATIQAAPPGSPRMTVIQQSAKTSVPNPDAAAPNP